MVRKISLLLLVSALLSACAALVVGAGLGAGSAVYVMGAHKQEQDRSVTEVYQATISGLRSLELPILSDQKDLISAAISSKFADGAPVKIQIEALGHTRSSIHIRVGVFGDRERSQRILSAINSRL